jgi:chromosome segregation ATPase
MTRVIQKDKTEQQLQARYNELKNRITALEHQEKTFVDRTKEIAELSLEKTKWEAEVILLKAQYKKDDNDLGEELNKKKLEISDAQRDLNILLKAIEETKQNFEVEQEKEEETRKKSIRLLDSEIQRKENEKQILLSKISEQNDTVKANELKVSQTADEVAKINDTVVKGNQAIVEIENKIEVFKRQEGEVAERVSKGIENETRILRKIEEKTAMLSAKEDTIFELTNKIKQKEVERKEAEDKVENLRSQIIGLVSREEKINDILPKLRVILEKAGSNLKI